MKKFKSLILIAFAGLALSACNGASLPVSSTYTEEELADLSSTIETPWVDYSAPATSVSFPEEELNKLLDKGDSYTYNPKISPKSTDMGSLIWTSQNSGVASIDKGKVTAVGGGVTTIEVSSRAEEMEKVELNVEVRVKLEDFTVSPSALDLDLNESTMLSVGYIPSDTTQKGVSFQSLNPEVVTVDQNGVVIAMGEGETTIKVTSDYSNEFKEVAVKVSDKTIHVSDVEIKNKPDAAIEINKTYQLEVKVSPDDAVSKDLEFSTSVASVADIDEKGLITTLNPGTTTIQVTSQENPNKFDLFDLEVFEVFADSVSLGDDLLLNLNGTAQLKPVYKNGEGAEVKPSRPNPEYSSSDASVASVTSAGVVKAMGVGEATITLTDGTLSASINVKVEIPTVTYTITDLPDWTPDFGADVFVWYWGGSVQGKFIKVDLDYDSEIVDEKTVYSNVTASFTTTSDISGFLLVRCVNGTTTPDWDIKYGNESGRIYNKTDDFVVMSGVTTYEFVEWIDYPELSNYTLKFSFDGNEWNDVDLTGKDEDTEFYIENFYLPTGSIFKVHMNEDWRGYSDIKPASPVYDKLDEAESDDNIVVLEGGYFDIYCKVNADQDGYIWIDLHDSSDEPFEPETDAVYTAVIGNAVISLEKQTLSAEDITNGMEAKYSANADVKKDEALVFKCDGKVISEHIGPNPDGKDAFNNFMQSGNSFTIQADADDALVEISVYKDGYSFWISGGTSSDHYEFFSIKVNLDTSVFASWEGKTSDYSLYAWSENGKVLLADFDNCKGNLNNGSVTIKVADGDALAGVVFYLTETKDGEASRKQSFDLVTYIPYESEWDLDFSELTWKEDYGVYKMAGIQLVKSGDTPEPPVADAYKVTIGSSEYTLVLDKDAEHTGDYADREALYTVAISSVTADDAVKLYRNGTLVAQYIQATGDDNNIVSDGDDGFKIKSSLAEEKTFYLNVWKENEQHEKWVSMYLQGPEVEKYDVTFNLDSHDFDAWEGVTSDYSLYLWNESGALTPAFDDCKGNLNSGSLTVKVKEGEKITGAIFYLYETKNETTERKQSVDLTLNVSEASEYDLNFEHLDWDEGKMTGITFDKKGETPEPPVADAYKLTIGESQYTLVLDEDAEHTGDYADREALYKVSIPSVVADAAVKLYRNDTLVSEFIQATGDDNNIISDGDDGFKIKSTLDAEKVFYLNVWKENAQHEHWVSMYLQGPEVEKYDVTFNLDAHDFDAWEGTTSDYSLYLWNDSGALTPAFDDCKGNLNSGSLTVKVKEGEKITGAVFYLYETKNESTEKKQSVDLVIDIDAEGEYDLNFEHLDWDGEGKMTGITFDKKGGSGGGSETPTTYKVSFECDVTGPAGWDPAASQFSLYVVLNDGTKVLGDWDTVKGNMTVTNGKATVDVDVPNGKKITMVIIYFVQDGVTKQSNDIEVDISAAGSYVITLGMTSWSENVFNGATCAAKD